MLKISKTVKKYLIQLLFIGIFQIFAGIVIAFVFLSSTNEIPLIYIPLIAVSAIAGYLSVIYWDPGGVVNFYLKKHKRSKDEDTLYNLVVKYRNKTLITFAFFIFFAIALFLGFTKHNTETIVSIDLILVVIIMPFASELCLGIGIKYISAWLNIRRNMEKSNGSYTIRI